jgi:hypothetical protein
VVNVSEGAGLGLALMNQIGPAVSLIQGPL